MVPEARLSLAEHRLVPKGDGWFVVNASEARWLDRPGRGLRCGFEGEPRPLERWDSLHCPAGTNHIMVGSGERPCVVLAVGARENSTSANRGGYPVDAAALRHGAGVEREATDVEEYARFREPRPARPRDGSLAGG